MKQNICLCLEKDTINKIDQTAKEDFRSRSQTVELIMCEHYKPKKYFLPSNTKE